MELRHLRYFEALAGTLNFSRAAEKSHVTQSTLSHQIKQLEEELGMQLFERKGKRVLMTEAGEILLNHISPALRQIDQISTLLRASSEMIAGNLRIGATHSFNIMLVPDCLSIFLNRYPSVRVCIEELSADSIVERLSHDELDIGISYRPDNIKDLHFEPLYNEEMKLIVASDHSLARRKRVRMAELDRLRMTLLPAYFSTRKLLDEAFLAAEAQPIVVVELNTVAAMIELVSRTDLAAIVSERIIPSHHKKLVVIPLETPTPMRTPGLLWKRGELQSAPARTFISTIRHLARD